jgi:hypothetical protein
MSCPACTSTRLTAIQIRLAPDEDHTFASCQACEWKRWYKLGTDVHLGRVLSLASERRFWGDWGGSAGDFHNLVRSLPLHVRPVLACRDGSQLSRTVGRGEQRRATWSEKAHGVGGHTASDPDARYGR